MNMENITRAIHSAQFLRVELQGIHREAGGENPFAEILALEMIADIAALQNKLARFADAARTCAS